MGQIIIFISIGLIITYFVFLLKDKNLNKNNPKISIVSILILFINIFGLLTFILPWVNVPILGSINAIKLSERFEDLIPVMILLGLIYLMFIFGSIIQISDKIVKKSRYTRAFEIIFPLIVSYLGYLTINDIESHFNVESDNIFSEALSMSISIGFGVYLIIILGIIQAIICLIMNNNATTKIKQENVVSNIQIDKNDIYNQLTKLHELKEKDLINGEIFEKERVILVNKLSTEKSESNFFENSKLEKEKKKEANFKDKLNLFFKIRKKSLLVLLFIIIAIVIYFLTINFLGRNKTNVFPYKISRELTTQYDEGEWKALREIPIYKTNEFKETIGSISFGGKFTMLDDYYLIEQPILAKITNIVQIDEECGINDLRVGDEIKLLIGYGECQWSILHNDSLKFATFGFDRENKKLIDCEYDGCTKIRGDIITTNERKSLIVKIRYNGKIGWIKYILDDINKYEFTDFIQSDY